MFFKLNEFFRHVACPRRINIVLFLCLGIIIRIIYLYQFSKSPLFYFPTGPDVEEYDLWAKQILISYNLFPSGAVPIHAPLYSLFLACLYKFTNINYFLVRSIQLGINLICGLLLFYVISNIDRSKRNQVTAYIFLFFWMTYTPLLFYQAELVAESLLIPLIGLGLYLLYKAEGYERKSGKYFFYLSGAGFICGCAVITHPYAMLFVFTETLWIFIWGWVESKKKSFSSGFVRHLYALVVACVFFLSASAVVLPICIRNSLSAGRFVLVQNNAGFNFFLGNNPNATGGCYIRPGKQWEEIQCLPKKELKTGNSVKKQHNINKDRYFISQSLNFILNHTSDWLILLIKKFLYTLNAKEMVAGADNQFILYYTPLLKHTKFFSSIIFSLSLLGVIIIIAELFISPSPFVYSYFHKYRHFLFLFFSFWVALAVFVTAGRYRVTFMASIFLFASYILTRCFFIVKILVCRYKNGRPLKKFASGIIFMLSAYIFCLLIIFIRIPQNLEEERFEAFSLWGEALMKSGELKKAEQYINNALLIKKESRLYNLLGIIERIKMKKNGNSWNNSLRKEEVLYRTAIEIDPESPLAFMNLGVLYSEKGNIEKAKFFLEQALKKAEKPKDISEILYNLGFLYQKNKNYTKALRFYLSALKINPAHRQSLNSVGVIYTIKGNFYTAVKYFKRALLLDPGNKGIRRNLALVYSMVKKSRKRE